MLESGVFLGIVIKSPLRPNPRRRTLYKSPFISDSVFFLSIDSYFAISIKPSKTSQQRQIFEVRLLDFCDEWPCACMTMFVIVVFNFSTRFTRDFNLGLRD